jgi:hypothetical protein
MGDSKATSAAGADSNQSGLVEKDRGSKKKKNEPNRN